MPKSPSYSIGSQEHSKVISLSDRKICKAYNKQLTVILADYQEEISSAIYEYLKCTIGNDLNLSILRAGSIDELYELSAGGSIDVFIIALENIVVPGKGPYLDSLKTTAQFISYCKTRWEKPIIVYSGLGIQFEALINNVKSIADCYFELPFRFNDFREALMRCLSHC